MVLLHSNTGSLEREITASVAPVVLQSTRSWSEMLRQARNARACIVVWEHLEIVAARRRLDELALGSHAVPVVLVTSGSMCNTTRLVDLTVAEVVFLERLGEMICPALERALHCRIWNRLAEIIRADSSLPLDLRTGLADLCDQGWPVRAISDIAKACHISVSTFERRWRSAMGMRTDLGPHGLVCAMRLLRIAETVTADRFGVKRISVVLGVDRRTLNRSALQILGQPLSRLYEQTPNDILVRILQRLGLAPCDPSGSAHFDAQPRQLILPYSPRG